MKKFLKFALGLLGGAVIGVAIVIMMVLLIDGNLSGFHDISDVKTGKLGLAICFSFLSMAIAVVLNIMLHEAGHLVFGLLTGYKFVSYRAFSLTLIKDVQGKFKWKKYSISGTLGQCLMEPPRDFKSENLPYFWYNAGGVIVNILLVIISLVMLKSFDLPMFWECFFFMMMFVGVAIALMNGLPLKSAGLNNDGSNIMELWKHPEKRTDMAHQLLIVAETSKGKRAIEMPEEWFPNPTITDFKDLITITTKNNYICWLEDNLRFEEALEETEKVMEHEAEIPQLIRFELGCDWLLLELALHNRPLQIERINTKQLWAYLQSAGKYSAQKQATFFAWQLIHENNPADADKILNDMKANQDNYAFIGEARTAIALMEHIKELYNGTGNDIESAQ
ncbi:MAG: M50 family metallopeptidase [Bacteroidaceae bacterium]|nr:M50 family metallopeptidase [Bacteroidaceae bacterium]MBR1542704.1 M50 family metallopeptidase [Bacteroidaceae bacterium]